MLLTCDECSKSAIIFSLKPVRSKTETCVRSLHTHTWGQLVSTTLNHRTCINTSRQVLEKTLFAINAIYIYIYIYIYTVKPVLVTTSIKQATCIKKGCIQFPKKANKLKFTCIKQAPVLSKQILIVPFFFFFFFFFQSNYDKAGLNSRKCSP